MILVKLNYKVEPKIEWILFSLILKMSEKELRENVSASSLFLKQQLKYKERSFLCSCDFNAELRVCQITFIWGRVLFSRVNNFLIKHDMF